MTKVINNLCAASRVRIRARHTPRSATRRRISVCGASPPECIRPCLCPRRPERQDLAQFRHDKAGIQWEAKKICDFLSTR